MQCSLVDVAAESTFGIQAQLGDDAESAVHWVDVFKGAVQSVRVNAG